MGSVPKRTGIVEHQKAKEALLAPKAGRDQRVELSLLSLA